MHKPKVVKLPGLTPPADEAELSSLSGLHEDWLARFPRAAAAVRNSQYLSDPMCEISVDPAVGDTLWAGRFFRIERWGTSEWQVGFGWWDGAVEIYLGPWIVRFQGYPAEYR